MASLQPVTIKGRKYYRIVESRRINGKPHAIPLLYLGTADTILQRMLEAPSRQLRVRSYQHGDVAALKAAADSLSVTELIDRHVPERRRGQSVGTTLLLAALNRAVQPRSKRGWAEWAATTSLHRLFPGLEVSQLTSQYFWDQMDCVSLDALRLIEDDLTTAVVNTLGIELDTLFYDTTNFFTYIDTTNTRSELPQRGKSKQKRTDLRLFGLALLVTRDGHIPLCSEVYEGNRVDCQVFPNALSRIRERLAQLSVEVEEVTIVYDKGNLSKRNQALVDDMPFGYVASVIGSHHPDLMAIPRSEYEPLPQGGPVGGVPIVRRRHEIWGADRTVVLFVSEQLREGQIRGLGQHLSKAVTELDQWKAQLAKPRSGPRSERTAQRRIDEILNRQHLRRVLTVHYDPKRSGAQRLRYSIDQEAIDHLQEEVFGKRILITNRHEWSTEDIILAYRGQSAVESVFRQCKDPYHLAVRPQFHWTDHKIQVHAFTCLLALLLARMVERRAREHGYEGSLSHLLNLLGQIRLAMILHPSGKKGGRPRADWYLEMMDQDQTDLYRHLVPAKPPFVYTAQTG